MKNKKIIIAIASVAMIAVVAIGGTLAYFTDSDKINDSMKLGKVDISITEKTNDESASVIKDTNGNVTGIVYSNIMPGDVISKEPVISIDSNSQKAYIRAKISINGVDGAYSEADGLSDYLNQITYNNEACGWFLGQDGYYYYQTDSNNGIVDPAVMQNISVFTETYIPTSWGKEINNKSFEIKIYAEAIQADYMTPIVNDGGKIIGWNE